MPEWYVLRTAPKREPLARKNLADQGFKTYLPLIACYRKQHGNRHLTKTLVPVFSRYLFIEMEWVKRTSVLSTRGVKGFVGWNASLNQAPHIRKAAMKELQARLPEISDSRASMTQTHDLQRSVEAGQLIQILLGPYKDHIAPVEQVIGQKVQIMLQFVGRKVPVMLAQDAVRAA